LARPMFVLCPWTHTIVYLMLRFTWLDNCLQVKVSFRLHLLFWVPAVNQSLI
jgi:hypothetical protein